MGTYRQPTLGGVDQSMDRANQELARGMNNFDLKFQQWNAIRNADIEKNLVKKEAAELQRAAGDKEWYNNLRKVTPKEGFNKGQDEMIKRLHDEYYSLIGKTDSGSTQRMAELLSVPGQLANGKGAANAIMTKYNAALGKGKGAGGINYYDSSAGNIEYCDVMKNNPGNIIPHEQGGRVNYTIPSSSKHSPATVLNNTELVEGSLDGKQFFLTNGSIAEGMDAKIQEITKTIPNWEKGLLKTDNTGTKHTQVRDYTEVNEAYKNKIKNADYTETLDNQDYMKSVFPQLIENVEKAARGGDVEAQRLLWGDDLKEGEGGDDYSDLMAAQQQTNAVMEAGVWVGSEEGFGDIAKKQRALAKNGFYQYATDSDHMKNDEVKVGETLVDPPKSNPSKPSAHEIKVNKAKNDPYNLKTYQNNQLNAQKALMKWESTSGDKKGEARPAAGIEHAAKSLNEILKNQIGTKPELIGVGYMSGKQLIEDYGYDPDGVNVNELYIYDDADKKAQNMQHLLKDSDELQRYMSVDLMGMDEEVYNYFETEAANMGYGDDVIKHVNGKYVRYVNNYPVLTPTTQAEVDEMKKSAKKGQVIEYGGKRYVKN